RIQPHRLRHLQAVTPVGRRDARIVHLARDNHEGLAIQLELPVAYLELELEAVRASGRDPSGGRRERWQRATTGSQKQTQNRKKRAFHAGKFTARTESSCAFSGTGRTARERGNRDHARSVVCDDGDDAGYGGGARADRGQRRL